MNIMLVVASFISFAVLLLWFEFAMLKHARQCGGGYFGLHCCGLYGGEVHLTENGEDRSFFIIGNIPFSGLSDFNAILRINASLKVSWYLTIVTTLAFIYCLTKFYLK
jgi:hypothetical protein